MTRTAVKFGNASAATYQLQKDKKAAKGNAEKQTIVAPIAQSKALILGLVSFRIFMIKSFTPLLIKRGCVFETGSGT